MTTTHIWFFKDGDLIVDINNVDFHLTEGLEIWKSKSYHKHFFSLKNHALTSETCKKSIGKWSGSRGHNFAVDVQFVWIRDPQLPTCTHRLVTGRLKEVLQEVRLGFPCPSTCPLQGKGCSRATLLLFCEASFSELQTVTQPSKPCANLSFQKTFPEYPSRLFPSLTIPALPALPLLCSHGGKEGSGACSLPSK